jgi:PAS domain S-box-containing protein
MDAHSSDNSRIKRTNPPLRTFDTANGILKIVWSKSPGGILMRRLLPAALLIPPLFRWLRFEGEQIGLYGDQFGAIFFSALIVVIFSLFIWRSAVAVNREEEERKEAEASLHQTEESFHLLFTSNPLPMWFFDSETLSFLEVNNAAVVQYGYTREEFLKMTLIDIRPLEEIPRLRADIEQHHTGIDRSGVWKHKKKDGTIIAVDITSHEITFAGKKAKFVLARDVTDLMKAEESLVRLAAIVEFSDDAIIGKTLDGIITSWNKGAERIFLYTESEMIGKAMQMLSPPERVGEEQEILRKIARGETINHFETVRMRKDGARIHVSTTISPIKDSAGAIIGISNITRDITEQKQAEEDLRNAENRYKSTLDSMMEGSQIIGFDFRYLYLNDIAAEQSKMNKADLLGRTMMEVYPGIEKTEMFAHLAACMKNRTPYHMENEFAFPDGTSNWFKLSMEPVPQGVFILSADITKEKQLSEEIKKHREHLEELVRERTMQWETANKELEAFSYSVSHDLRAPLRHIDGFADLLKKHASATGGLDDQSRRYITIISESAKHMGVLIDELLVFSRMGRVEMRTTKVTLEPLVKGIIAEASNDIQGRVVDWKIDPLPEVQGDPSMLRLVLQNLIGNAVKYTRPREKAMIHVGSKMENNEVVLFVQDNGVGFDMQYVDKLFGVFQRLHRSEDFEGTGVGLANVRRIIERHGGRTWAEGEIDKGATFYFSLPALS